MEKNNEQPSWLDNLNEEIINQYVAEKYGEDAVSDEEMYFDNVNGFKCIIAFIKNTYSSFDTTSKLYFCEFGTIKKTLKGEKIFAVDEDIVKLINKANINRKINGKTYKQDYSRFVVRFLQNKKQQKIEQLEEETATNEEKFLNILENIEK